MRRTHNPNLRLTHKPGAFYKPVACGYVSEDHDLVESELFVLASRDPLALAAQHLLSRRMNKMSLPTTQRHTPGRSWATRQGESRGRN